MKVANKNGGAIFIERSLKNALSFLKEAVFSEEIALSEGLLQSLDPRMKLALLVFAVVATCFARSIPVLLGLYALSLVLAFLSGINILFFIKRVWLFIPIFTLFIAIPAIFIQSLFSAVVFVLRVATCVSFTVLVTVTTRHNQLLKSLRSFGVPSIFVQVLDMTYRYIFLFINIFEEMHLSLKSRLIKKFSAKLARRWVAGRMGYLFKRSLNMSEGVYMAMMARGYTLDTRKYGK